MNNVKTTAVEEHVSALMDGDETGLQAVQAVLTDPESAQTWHAYHVVRDVLSSAELAPGQSGLAFLTRLEARLATEPLSASLPEVVAVATVPQISQPAANASVFGWKLVATAACIALVGMVGLQMLGLYGGPVDGQMAQVQPGSAQPPSVIVAESPAGSMLRDPRLDELMAAHRQLGGHSALQVPAGFLRNATYEGTGR